MHGHLHPNLRVRFVIDFILLLLNYKIRIAKNIQWL